MNSSKGHLWMNDVRLQRETIVPVVKLNRVREGESGPRRSVRRKYNERLVSFGSRPPKMVLGNLMSLSVISGSFVILRRSSTGAEVEKYSNKRPR